MLRSSIIEKLEREARKPGGLIKDQHLILIGFGTKRELEQQLMEQSSISREELRELARANTFWGIPVLILRDVESTLMLVKRAGEQELGTTIAVRSGRVPK